ncbi:hypothetical protein K1719_006091 [Acacia pycnantha]|nr:hypothetical protein K1719_006091 [Acacia pycnantha]
MYQDLKTLAASESSARGTMEKLIYVHVARLGDSLNRKKGMFSGYYDATNDWYVIKQRGEGRGDRVKMSRVFEGAGQLNHPHFALLNTGCVVIGSLLYVIDGKSVRRLPKPSNCTSPPSFSTSLSPGTLVAYMRGENTLYQLDCKNSAWTVYHKDFLPYSYEELLGSSFTVDDDGIVYIYFSGYIRLISFDIRNKKELHAVDLPRSFWFGLEDPVQFIVLSKNKFCLLWDRMGTNMNKRRIYYSRFSVSYDDLPDPTLHVEETRSFLVAGYEVLNVVTVDSPADVGSSRVDVSGGGEKPK